MKNKFTNKSSGTQINIKENKGVIINNPNEKSDKKDNILDRFIKLPKSTKLVVLFLILILISISIYLLKNGYTIDTKFVKVTPPIKSDDTISNPKITILENQSDLSKPDNMSILKDKKSDNKPTFENSGSGTQININKNEGIVAPNSTINISSDLPPRNLKDPNLQNELERFILNTMKSHNRDKTCPIKIRVDHSSQEAINHANEIYNYLKQKKYNVQGTVNLEIFSPPLYQTGIFYEKSALYQDEDSTIHIKVGLNKPRQ